MGISVRPRSGIIVYIVALVSGAFFSQAFISPVSAAVFRFIIMLPLTAVIPFAVLPFISVKSASLRSTAVHGGKSTAGFVVKNRGLVPLSVCEAELKISGEDSKNRKVVLSVPPFSRKIVVAEKEYGHVGKTEITVARIGLCDPLRLICVSKRCAEKAEIFIVPKPVDPDGVSRAPEKFAGSGEEVKTGEGDYSGVRGYIPGDRLKDIHWKLSSKGDELFSVERNEGHAGTVKIGAMFPHDAAARDAAADMLLTVCSEIIKNGNRCLIASNEDELEVKGSADIDGAAVFISGICRPDGFPAGTGYSACVVPFADAETFSGISDMPAGNDAVIILTDLSEILPEKAREGYFEAFEKALSSLAESGKTAVCVRYAP